MTASAQPTVREQFQAMAARWIGNELTYRRAVARHIRDCEPFIEEVMADVPRDDKDAPHAKEVARGKAEVLGVLFGSCPRASAAILAIAAKYGIKSQTLDAATMRQLADKTGLTSYGFWEKVAKEYAATEADRAPVAASFRSIAAKVSSKFSDMGWRERAAQTKETAAVSDGDNETAGTKGGFVPKSKDDNGKTSADVPAATLDDFAKLLANFDGNLGDVMELVLRSMVSKGEDVSDILLPEVASMFADVEQPELAAA